MSAAWRSRLMALFLVASLCLLLAFNVHKPRVLVLHSFSQERVTTQRFDASMDAVFKDNRMPIRMSRLYLNQGQSSTPSSRQQAISQAKSAIDRFDPDVLVLVDDEANELIGRSQVGKSHRKLVYAAINRSAAFYGYTNPNQASGIEELLPLAAIRDLLTQWDGKTHRRVAVLGVSGSSEQALAQQIQDFDWSPHSRREVALVKTFEEWKAFVEGPAREADTLLILGASGLVQAASNPQSVPVDSVIAWTEAQSRALPIGLHSSYVRQGGGFALSSPRAEQGRLAALYALDWLGRSNSGSPMAPAEMRHFDVSIRTSKLARRNIQLPAVYTEAARSVDNLYP